VLAPEELGGQPHQTQSRPAPVRTRSHLGPHGQDRARLPTAVTSTFEDLQLLDTASAGVTTIRRHTGSSSDVPATNRMENS
jgi:hypothetical protein